MYGWPFTCMFVSTSYVSTSEISHIFKKMGYKYYNSSEQKRYKNVLILNPRDTTLLYFIFQFSRLGSKYYFIKKVPIL